MKTHLLLMMILLGFATWLANAQTANLIPNGDFENWTSTSYKLPSYFPWSSNLEAVFSGGNPNVKQITSAFHGSYAVRLETIVASTDTVTGILSNASDLNGPDPADWEGGIPYSEAPVGIRGYYTYNVGDNSDSAIVAVMFKKNSENIGTYIYYIGGNKTSPSLFQFNFSPTLNQTPDSVLIIFTSSDVVHSESGKPGSILTLDSISFTGVTSQPSMLNGDFEQWTDYSTNPMLDNWYSDYDKVSRTTDAVSGMYAVQLTTIAENGNGHFRLSPGYLSNGIWNEFTQKMDGGFPCEIQKDTLVFWYKYMPSNPDDKAMVSINFKKNNITIGGNDINLNSSAVYTLVKLPIDLGGNISDSAIIQISSSLWQGDEWADTAESYVGAVLKIDGLSFLSTISTIVNKHNPEENIVFYPNPVKTIGVFMMPSDMNLTDLQILFYNVNGKMIKKIPVVSNQVFISKEDFIPGIYMYQVIQEKNVLKKGKIIIE
ncbi:MAG: T9SS type A sorting domain-containing protein [Bacteroidales bacterium]